jgi:hypothetical protein
MSFYMWHKYTERDRQRQLTKDEFKRKHKITNRVFEYIVENSAINNWLRWHGANISKVFKELFIDISETVFGEVE